MYDCMDVGLHGKVFSIIIIGFRFLISFLILIRRIDFDVLFLYDIMMQLG